MMEKDQVIARIDDWERRLNELFTRIGQWFWELPPDPARQLFPSTMLQLDEDPLRQFDIPPRMLPTLAIVYGKNRVSFTPSTLWVIRANGRINVSTNTQRFILVDVGGANGQPSDWQIITSRVRNEQRPFDRQIFNNLVLHQAIEAA